MAFIAEGTEIVAWKGQKEDKLPVLIVKFKAKKYAVMAGNFNGNNKDVSIGINGKYLNVTLPAHSLNTFIMK